MACYHCPTLKPYHLFCDQHKITDFDALYEIINGKVQRKADRSLVILLGYDSFDDHCNPDLIRACLMGQPCLLPIARIDYVPENSWYRIVIDPMDGDQSLEIFDETAWSRS